MGCETWKTYLEEPLDDNISNNLQNLKSEVICPLSELSLLQEEDLRKIPKFEKIDDFVASDFFTHYYFLWEKNISFDRDENFLQQYGLFDSRYIQNLQRILISLWYLDKRVLSGTYCDIHPDSLECSVNDESSYLKNEDAFFYFGVFWSQTIKAVKLFQVNNGLLWQGWIVWPETRQRLYQKIFEVFHRK